MTNNNVDLTKDSVSNKPDYFAKIVLAINLHIFLQFQIITFYIVLNMEKRTMALGLEKSNFYNPAKERRLTYVFQLQNHFINQSRQ